MLVVVAGLAVLLVWAAWSAQCSIVTCPQSPAAPSSPAGPDGSPSGDPGPAEIAAPHEASSDPTYYSNSHRTAQTAGGRLLVLYGRHASGLQLAWRDAGSDSWRRNTTGDVTYGQILWGTDTGDWPASLTVLPGPQGSEVAVAVWAGENFSPARDLTLRVLTDLDSPDGPQVGAQVTVAAPPLGAARPDVAVEVGADGTPRALLTWTERTSADSYAIITAWLEDPRATPPALTSPAVLYEGESADRTATVAGTPGGARVAATTDKGRVRVFGHDLGTALDQWWASGTGVEGPRKTYPSAVALPGGDVLVASAPEVPDQSIAVQRFAGPGRPPTTELEIAGYTQGDLVAGAGEIRLVAIRAADGFVVSRRAAIDGGWTLDDRIEIGAEGGPGMAWPDAFAGNEGCHVVVRGPGSVENRSSVLVHECADWGV